MPSSAACPSTPQRALVFYPILAQYDDVMTTKRRVLLQIRLTAKEKRRIEREARASEQTLSAYVRSVLWLKREAGR